MTEFPNSSEKTEKKDSPSSSNFYFRLILFAFAVAAANFWFGQHLRLHKGISLFVSFLAIAYTFLTFLFGLGTEKEQADAKNSIRHALGMFLNRNFLIILYLIVLFFGTAFSSVSIYSGANTSELNVMLCAEASIDGAKKVLKGPNEVVSYVRYTTLFGKPYFIEVDGYMRKSFQLYPWVGKQIKVEKDLELSPSVYLRIPLATEVLKEGSVLVIEDGDTLVQEALPEGASSFIVGSKRPIPQSWKSDWQNYLEELGGSDQYQATLYNAWNSPRYLQLLKMKPGRQLDVYCLNRKEIVRAQVSVTVSSLVFEDILMQVNPY